MSRFERKFGKYAIRNLSVVLVCCYAIGYTLQFIVPWIAIYLSLDPYAILHGQVWRLVTWILIPPDSSNIFLTRFLVSIGKKGFINLISFNSSTLFFITSE